MKKRQGGVNHPIKNHLQMMIDEASAMDSVGGNGEIVMRHARGNITTFLIMAAVAFLLWLLVSHISGGEQVAAIPLVLGMICLFCALLFGSVKVVLSDEGIERHTLWIICRRVPWDRVTAYRVKQHEEVDNIITPQRWAIPGINTVTTYSMWLYVQGGLPITVDNGMSGFQKAKKFVKAKGVPHKKKKQKKNDR